MPSRGFIDAESVSSEHTRAKARSTMRDARSHAGLAAVTLFVLMAAVHHQIVFMGRSLVHTNFSNPLDWRPLPQNYGEGMIPHDEWTRRGLWPFPNIRDPAATWWQWEPSTEFLKQAIADREWPFWDPYVSAGTPAMANLVQAFFFPPYTVMVALGASVPLKNAYFLTLLWSASFLTYLFLRRHDLGFAASLGGAIVVLMGGSLNQNLGAFAGQTIACLPLTLYTTRLMLDRPDRRRAAVMALAYASSALSSFPPILIGVFGITALYALMALAFRENLEVESRRLRTAGWWICGTLVSVGLVAFYYVPAFALRGATPQVAAAYHGVGLETMPFVKGLQLLSPNVLGGVQIYWNDPLFVLGAAHIPYVGVVALLAALVARPGGGRQRALFWASAAASALILLKLFGVPPVQWIGHLPFLGDIHLSHYLGVPLGFPLAFLAALGIDRIAKGSISVLAGVIAAVTCVIGVEGAYRLASSAGVFEGPTAHYWNADWRVLAVVTVASATAGVVAPLVARDGPRRVIVALLLALAVTEGVYNNSYLKPKAWNLFDHPVPYVRVLQHEAHLTRVFPFGAPAANVNEAFGIFSLSSVMAFNPPRVYDLYQEYAGAPPSVFLRDASRIPPEPVLDRANVSFVGMYTAMADLMREAQSRQYESRFTDGFFTLFRRSTRPRFFFSSEYQVLPRSEALKAIATAPSQTIVLEEHPGFDSTSNAPGDPHVRVESYRRNAVTVAVDAPRLGLLYASESFFEGWTATVNGQPSRILPANYAFRAVVVPAGPSRVEFHYWPPGLTLGLMISGVSVVALAGLVIRPSARSVTIQASPGSTTPRPS
jgi:hypothetical protein